MSFERDDCNTVSLRLHELRQDRLDAEYERKLAEFKRDPYSYCEWNIEAFGIYDMLGVVLEVLLPDFDADISLPANQCARKDLLAAIRDSVDKVEL